MLYRVRTERVSASAVEAHIRKMLKKVEAIIAPLHIRHHWTLAIFSSRDDRLRARVYDSAPSPVTRRDINGTLCRLHTAVEFEKVPKQPRGSNECGVHTVVHAWRQFFGLGSLELGAEESLPLSRFRADIREIAESQSTPETVVRAQRVARVHQGDVSGGTRADDLIGVQRAKEARQDAKRAALSHGGMISEEIFDAACAALRERIKDKGGPTIWPTDAFESWSCLRFDGIALPVIDTEAVQLFPIRLGGLPGEMTAHFSLLISRPGRNELIDPLNKFDAPFQARAREILHAIGRPPAIILRTSPQQGENECAVYVARAAATELGLKVTSFITRKWMVDTWEKALESRRAPANSTSTTDIATTDISLTGNQLHPPRGRVTFEERRESANPPTVKKHTHNPYRAVLEHPSTPAQQQSKAQQAERQDTAQVSCGHPMKRGEVARRMRGLSAGELIKLKWAHARGAEAGRWVVEVRGNATYGLTRTVVLRAVFCEQCEAWHAPEEQEDVWEVPFSNVLYFELERITAIPSLEDRACEEEEEHDVDDDGDQIETSAHSATEQELQRELSIGAKKPTAQLGDLERSQDVTLPIIDKFCMTGRVGQKWFVHRGRPAHVPSIAWLQLAESTRRIHASWIERIRGMPMDLADLPLGTALVMLAVRLAAQRKWTWPTISSALSAIRSALALLPLYTNAVQPINLVNDAVFNAAMLRARHLARVTVKEGRLSAPLTESDFAKLVRGIKEGGTNIKRRSAWILASLSWYLAARVGDLRQVRPSDLDVRLPPKNGGARDDTTPNVPMTCTFRYGKGAAFWGPFTVHACLPYRVAQALLDHIHGRDDSEPVFSTADQALVSTAIKAFPGCSLRSLRKGALTHFAACGVLDESLMLISGHKRTETLLRYLGWGRHSSAARKAAEEVAKKTSRPESDTHGGGETSMDGNDSIPPTKMGEHSGFWGNSGKRTRKPPKLFPLQAPSEDDLGIAKDQKDTGDYAFHVKYGIGTVNWDAVIAMAKGTAMQEVVDEAWSWVHDATRLCAVSECNRDRIPAATFTSQQTQLLIDSGKIRPLGQDEPVLGWVNGFTVPQHDKRRLRPIFEPFLNRRVDGFIRPEYPSRNERHTAVRHAKFVALFDFEAFFDQFTIPSELQNRFVMRVVDDDGKSQFFCVTKLPMGAKWSPGVAQVVTWLLLLPIVEEGRTAATSMIDNARLATDDPVAFVSAVRKFLSRCEAAGVTLNDATEWKLTDQGILKKGAELAKRYTFLGEEYCKPDDLPCGIRNTTHICAKLRSACELMQRGGRYTRRQFVSLVGLVIFMTGTVDMPLFTLPRTLRAYSAIASAAADAEGWEGAVTIAQPVVDELLSTIQTLLKNDTRQIGPPPQPPPGDARDYDAVIFVDASASGYGAYAALGQDRMRRIFELRGGWSAVTPHSAHAEPRAAQVLLEWVKEAFPESKSIALVVDHQPMATAQRRNFTRHGGFSGAWPLNQFFRALYEGATDGAHREVFFCEGTSNIADAISRSNRIGDGLRVREAFGVTLPNLDACTHPYAGGPDRLWWKV